MALLTPASPLNRRDTKRVPFAILLLANSLYFCPQGKEATVGWRLPQET